MKKLIISFYLLFFIPCIFSEDAEQKKIKEVIEKYKNTIVTVKIIRKEWSVMEGKEFSKGESKNEVSGTIIDKNGTVIVSAFAVDPTKFFNQLSSGRSFKFEWRSQITGIKIILPDKKEIDGKMVLKDEKLDLIFIRPESKEKRKYEYVNLKDYIEPDIMEKIVIMSRIGKIGNRTIFASLSRIGGIIKKPRDYYLSTDQMASPGSPVFTVNGKIVGINLIRTKKRDTSFSFSIFSPYDFGFLPVILPAKEIKEIAGQIKEN